MKSKILNIRYIVLSAVIALIMIACDLFGDKNKEVDNSKYYLDPPTGVAATILSNSELHLTWNAVSGAGQYEISVRSNLDSADTRPRIGTISNTSIAHGYYYWYSYHYSTRAEEVTTIYYYVKAHPSRSGYIESGWSSPASVNVKN